LFGLQLNGLDLLFTDAVSTQLHGAEGKLREIWNGEGMRNLKAKADVLGEKPLPGGRFVVHKYEGWNFNSGNYLFTTDTK